MDGSADAAAGGGAQASALHADILELVARCWPSDAEAQALLDELRVWAAAAGGDGRPGDDAADEDELSSSSTAYGNPDGATHALAHAHPRALVRATQTRPHCLSWSPTWGQACHCRRPPARW